MPIVSESYFTVLFVCLKNSGKQMPSSHLTEFLLALTFFNWYVILTPLNRYIKVFSTENQTHPHTHTPKKERRGTCIFKVNKKFVMEYHHLQQGFPAFYITIYPSILIPSFMTTCMCIIKVLIASTTEVVI